MQSKDDKKINNIFDFMSFEEKAIFILNLAMNRTTRGNEELYIVKMPIEQQLALCQIRFAIYCVSTDLTEIKWQYQEAEREDKLVLEALESSIKQINQKNLPELMYSLNVLYNHNARREMSILLAISHQEAMKKSTEGITKYLKAIEMDTTSPTIPSVDALSLNELERINEITDFGFVNELEGEDFTGKRLKALSNTLEDLLKITKARIRYNRPVEKSPEEMMDELNILQKRMKKLGINVL